MANPGRETSSLSSVGAGPFQPGETPVHAICDPDLSQVQPIMPPPSTPPFLSPSIPAGGAVNTSGTDQPSTSFQSLDVFFAQSQIDGKCWSKYFPYQLVMLEPNGSGGYKIYDKEIFTLPISPGELQIRSPFAINLSVTLKGIVEEHNAAPLREISFSGTTGVLPGDSRESGVQKDDYGILGTVFAGTIAGAENFTSAFNGMVGKKTSGSNTSSILPDNRLHTTGYYYFRRLDQFIERYVLIKKGMSAKNLSTPHKSIRLAFTNWKEEAIWLITPRDWTWRKTAGDPHSYFYSFSATAWKRISSFDNNFPYGLHSMYEQVGISKPDGFQTALNTILSARDVVYGAKGVVEGFRGDINDHLLEPMREVTLLVKEAAGAARTLFDLPGNLRTDFQQTVTRCWGNLKDGFQTLSAKDGEDLEIQQAMGDQYRDSQSQTVNQTRLPSDTSASPIGKLFRDTFPKPSFFESIELHSLDTPPEIVDAVQSEVSRVTSLERSDLIERSGRISSVSEQLANQMGAGSATYTRLIGSDSGSSANTYSGATASDPLTDDQLDVLFALQRSVQVFDSLVATTKVDDSRIPSAMEYVAALANSAQIPFSVPRSQYLAPVPLGFSLETIANIYLGNPDRWSEIAILNGLRPPYIDEVGFTLEFLTNGTSHQFFTVRNATDLFVGQNVRLYSNTVPITKHRIVSIETISENNFLITVDGDPLDQLKTTDKATLQAYLPGTTNSEQLIYIPSMVPTAPSIGVAPIPGIDALDHMVQKSGIDFLLTPSGDLAMSSDGDLKLAYGLTNLVQACRLKMAVPLGSLLRHPSFGFGIEPGTNNADVTIGHVLKAAQGSFANDERFSGIASLKMQKRGPVLQIDLSTAISGINVLVPVSIQIPAAQ